MVNAGNRPLEATLSDLILELNESDDPNKTLRTRLREIYNGNFRKLLLFPLLSKLESRNLKTVVLSYYRDFYPKDIPDSFLDRMMDAKGDLFLDLLELYVRSGKQAGFERIDQRLSMRRSVSPAEILLHCEILIRLGEIQRALKKLPFDIESFPEAFLNRARSLHGIILFYQGRFKACTEQMRKLFSKDDYRDSIVDYLVDAFLLMGQNQEAFRYAKIFASEEFENPGGHLLRSKIFLMSGNFREARKEWKRAKAMGAFGERFHIQSFYISQVTRNLVTREDLGPFTTSSDSPNFSAMKGLDRLRFLIYQQEFRMLQQKNPTQFSQSLELPYMVKASLRGFSN